MLIGTKNFDTDNNTYIMGILNVTPDSFYDGGKWDSISRALEHTKTMIEEGADIIDIGGESTRPGYTQISSDEEIERIVPVISEIKKNFDISYGVNKDKDKIRVYLLSDKADSAFMLLPYFRDKIQYDPNKKRWIIIRDRVVVK